ncbi:hypothetical protein [Thiomicrorhabdus cannonii]|uniref:hypothetical protein n=1 Tax=Thiomicrorhabdus cannonii TaxID=2748011 RepID=UPI0015C186C5|nr:hypothetical protein [Thiomicrorhabdus cannonii]
MTELLNQLKILSKIYPLEGYTWGIDKNCPLLIPEGMSEFEQNVFLKENFAPLLDHDTNLDNHYWIINEWGKIRSFKRTPNNDSKILEFNKRLQSGKLTRTSFDLISSLSKIASFKDPMNFAIYDSRAVYALNWLLFRYSPELKLFPQPAGRNSEMSKFDQGTIFRLSGQPFEYESHKDAYHSYCDLLKQLSHEVYGDKRPFNIEMLLFQIGPEHIVNDIKNSVKLTIN